VSTFGFRLRFFIHGPFIDSEAESLSLSLPDGHSVILSAVHSGGALRNANELQVRASGFDTSEAALQCGERLRNAIRKSSASLKMGFDVGKDRATSGASKFVKDQAAAGGYRLLNDVHGLCVFEEDLPVRVLSMRGQGQVLTPPSRVLDEWIRQYKAGPSLSDKETLALELYSVAHAEPFVRAKFLTLISVVEVLAPVQTRSADVGSVVKKLIVLAHEAKLTTADTNSLVGGINNLKTESIGRSCRAYIEQRLGEATAREFAHLYGVRSKITHSGDVPADTDLVAELTKLESIVAALLERVGAHVSVI
jgi:hypothetical protein